MCDWLLAATGALGENATAGALWMGVLTYMAREAWRTKHEASARNNGNTGNGTLCRNHGERLARLETMMERMGRIEDKLDEVARCVKQR